MMITEDYVSFETAKLLKEKGYDCAEITVVEQENGKDCYISNAYLLEPNELSANGYYAPTIQKVMKWLRKEKGIAIIPLISSIHDNESFFWDAKIVIAKTDETYSQAWVYESYEDACESAIKYCLENLI